MRMTAEQITIAITVYDRRQYLVKAIDSALSQTVPVRVMVVEDCGPDPTIEAFVRSHYGGRAPYHRNSKRRGIFGNLNACVERCTTQWLSILADDDYLEPGFVAAMIQLSELAPGRALYFGDVTVVDERDRLLPRPFTNPSDPPWQPVDKLTAAHENPLPFPGQLFRGDVAQALGGFRESAFYVGDWELWMKMIAIHGAAKLNSPVAFLRHHGGTERGTTRVDRNGKKYGLINVQRKRNLAFLRQMGVNVQFDRRVVHCQTIWAGTFLIKHGAGFSSRFLRYNIGLLLASQAPKWWLRVFKITVCLLRRPAVLAAARLYKLTRAR